MKSETVEHDDPKPGPSIPRPAPPAPAVHPDAPVLPGHQTASPDERIKALEMAMAYHTGKTVDHGMLISTAKAFLDFLHEKPVKG